MGKIEALENKLAVKDKIIKEQSDKIERIDSDLNVARNALNIALQHCDDVEQYTRKYSVRIYGLPVEKNENLLEKVKNCYDEVNISFNKDNIDRVHRIGREKFVAAKDVYVQPVILKFRYWNARYKFYRAIPKLTSKKKPGGHKFSVGLDLTKRRLDLLRKARERIDNENINGISFAFVDINCALGIRFDDGSIKFFNDDKSLQELLSNS